jgi:hypothetical protein
MSTIEAVGGTAVVVAEYGARESGITACIDSAPEDSQVAPEVTNVTRAGGQEQLALRAAPTFPSRSDRDERHCR